MTRNSSTHSSIPMHANLTQQASGEYYDGTPAKKSGYVPTPEQRRIYARKSTSGGRTYCDKCGYAFSAEYVKPVQVTFRTLNLCEDCRRK